MCVGLADLAALASVLKLDHLLPDFAAVSATMSAAAKIILSVFSPTAFALALDRMLDYQTGNQGATFENLNDVIGNFALSYSVRHATQECFRASKHCFSFLDLQVAMLVVDTVLYLLLAGYIAKVFPTEGQTPYPFHFFLQPSFWFDCCASESKALLPLVDSLDEDSSLLEPVSAEVAARPALHIRGLSKTYPGAENPSVNNLNLSCYEGQIFVLLGHNGAGKR